MKGRLGVLGIAVLALVSSSCGGGSSHGAVSTTRPPETTTTTTAASNPLAPRVTIALLRPQFAVVGLVNAPAAGRVELEMTTDFVHWRDVTPPVPQQGRFGGISAIRDVSFPTPETGWVVVSLPSSALELYRTTDAGTTWHVLPGGVTSGGAAGDELIDFLDAGHGWREVIAPTAGGVSLSATSDGGETWSPLVDPARWPAAGILALSRFSRGFLADTLPPSQDLPDDQPLSAFSPLWETIDGGRDWHRADIALPSGFAGAQSYEGLPTFIDADHGVLPVFLLDHGALWVSFFGTSSGGDSWSDESSVRLGVPRQSPTSPSDLLPAVAMAGPDTWWIVDALGPSDPVVVRVTDDAGRSWTSVPPAGLPSSPPSSYPSGITSIQARSATTAWVMEPNGPGCGLFGTIDRGRNWMPVCPGR